MAQRQFNLTGTLVDLTSTPIAGAPISVVATVPSGGNPLDGNGDLVSVLLAQTTTASNGTYTLPCDYPGDFRTTGCGIIVNENGKLTYSPPGFTYAASIATSSWYTPTAPSDTLEVIADISTISGSAVPGDTAQIFISQTAIGPSTQWVSAAQPISAISDSNGRFRWWLLPNSVLAPTGTTYSVSVVGEPSTFVFTVPATPTGYQGAYSGSTAYYVHDGTNYEGPFTPTLNPPDVVLYSGVYYVAIADTTGNLPTNATYWAVWPGEKLIWHLTVAVTAGSVPLAAVNIAHDSNVPALVGDPVQTPTTLDDDLHNLAFRTGLALTWQGAWSSATTYRTYDVVESAGTAYVCILGNLNQTPPNATYWEPVGSAASDATTTTTGVVEVDAVPGSGHPIALTVPRLGAASGVAELDSGGLVPVAELPLATSTTVGVVKPDNTTLIISSGVLSTAASNAFSWSTKTANYTITTTDTGIAVNAASGDVVITLPTAVAATQEYAIKRLDTSSHTVSLVCTSGQTIDGNASVSFVATDQTLIVGSDGANWQIAATYYPSPLTTESDIPYLHSGVLSRLTLGTGLSIASGVLDAAPLLEITDGTTDLTAVSKITFTGATVGGTSSAATLNISRGELLMQDGVSSPPIPLTNEAGTDWLYQG